MAGPHERAAKGWRDERFDLDSAHVRSAELLTFGGRAKDAVWMAGHYGFIACMIGFSAIGGVLMVPQWNARPSRGGGR